MHGHEIEAFLHGDYDRVVLAVTAVCGDRHRAEDAVQEALVDVWEKRRSLDDLTGWVTTVALNRSRSWWRSQGAERRALLRLGQRTTADPGQAARPFSAGVAEALRALPRGQREVVALHYLLDMSVVDVAERLDVTEGTVKTQLHRARSALRTALGETNAPEEATHV